jgi:hypothetical protein
VYASLGMKDQAQSVQRRLRVISPDLASELAKKLIP